MPGFGLNFAEKPSLCLVGSKSCYFRKPLLLLLDAGLQEHFRLGDLAFLAGQFFLRCQQFVLSCGGFFQLFFKAAAHFFKLAFAGLDLALTFLEFVFELAFLVKQIILTLKQKFFLLGLRLFARFCNYAFRQIFGVANTLCGRALVRHNPQRNPQQRRSYKRCNEQWIHESSLSLLSIRTLRQKTRADEHRQAAKLPHAVAK